MVMKNEMATMADTCLFLTLSDDPSSMHSMHISHMNLSLQNPSYHRENPSENSEIQVKMEIGLYIFIYRYSLERRWIHGKTEGIVG